MKINLTLLHLHKTIFVKEKRKRVSLCTIFFFSSTKSIKLTIYLENFNISVALEEANFL